MPQDAWVPRSDEFDHFRQRQRLVHARGETLHARPRPGTTGRHNGMQHLEHAMPFILGRVPRSSAHDARFEALVPLSEDDASWLDDDPPHVCRRMARGLLPRRETT